MKVITKVEAGPKDPEQVLEEIGRKFELKTIQGIQKGIAAVKRHLVAMTQAKLTKRSGALLKDVAGANTDVISTGETINGTIRVPGMTPNKRGQFVSQYLRTHFGKGSITISAKNGMLSIPIQGGPAWKGSAPTAAPKDIPGILFRISQVLYAGRTGKSRTLEPAFVLKPSVTITRRVNPQDAVDEAQMEILEALRGLIGSVN